MSRPSTESAQPGNPRADDPQARGGEQRTRVKAKTVYAGRLCTCCRMPGFRPFRAECASPACGPEPVVRMPRIIGDQHEDSSDPRNGRVPPGDLLKPGRWVDVDTVDQNGAHDDQKDRQDEVQADDVRIQLRENADSRRIPPGAEMPSPAISASQNRSRRSVRIRSTRRIQPLPEFPAGVRAPGCRTRYSREYPSAAY